MGTVAGAVSMLVSNRLLTEFLDPERYGEFVLLMGLFVLARALAGQPLYWGLIRQYPDFARIRRLDVLRADATRLVDRWLLVGCFGTIVVAVGMLGQATPVLGVSLLLLMLWIDGRRTIEHIFMQAARRQRELGIQHLLLAVLRPMLLVGLMLSFAQSVSAAIGVQLLVIVAGWGMFRWWFPREGVSAGTNRADAEPSARPRLIRFAVPLVPLGLIVWTLGQSDRYILAGFGSLESAGNYAAKYGMTNQTFNPTSLMLQAFIGPIHTTAVSAGNHRREIRLFWGWIGVSMLVLIIGVVICWWLHRVIAGVLVAEEYRFMSYLMVWLALGCGLNAMSDAFNCRLLAAQATALSTICYGVSAAICVGVTIWFVKVWGIDGAAYAAPVYFGLQTLLLGATSGVAMSKVRRESAAGIANGRTDVITEVTQP